MAHEMDRDSARIRVGQAAEMLGVSVETLRRWEADGRIAMSRSDGGQRVVAIDEVARLLAERRRAALDRPIVAQSARNRFAGVVTRIERDRVAAVVEVMAGAHRLVSLMKDAGARIDATFHCPHYPAVNGPCECRKPGTLLYRRAAEQFGIDLAASLYVGDRDRDIAPGLTFGGFARLVPSPSTPETELNGARERGLLATSLGDCVEAYMIQRQ